MELNITCKTSADTAYKELLPLENTFSPYEIYAVATTLDPGIDGLFVYYQWSHPHPEQVFVYETEVYESDQIIHRMNVSSAIMNATCQIENITMCNNCYSVVVTAVDRCGQRSMNSTNIEIVADTRTVKVEDESKLNAASITLIPIVAIETVLIVILTAIAIYLGRRGVSYNYVYIG
ncbi:hypothetical protein GBAR_LOCUS8023 [Geodia barretti]|uniref:Uncharacterized protein n=1 Tax=Geodia barretti TaxID=519541 RepID=A0AA35RJX3_GEOBA|nr:hypothetical protein GBAR_LOCUS8023 [Geodia barretti]